MKKLFTILALTVTFIASAQLNSTAQIVKDRLPIEYKLIKKFAEDKWGQDFEMIVYTINEHADAMREFANITNAEGTDLRLMRDAYKKWTDNSIIIEGKPFVDYPMVVYTYKKQLEAKNQY